MYNDYMSEYSRAHISALFYRFVTRGLVSTLLFLVFALIVAIVYTSGKLDSFPWIAVLIIMGLPLAWKLLTSWLEYMNLGYSFDDKSLKFREGIFSLHNQTIPFYKISNASFTQSFFQRVFNVGDVIIDQEDSQSDLKAVDRATAEKIIQSVSQNSNIQTIQTRKEAVNNL